MRVQLNRLGREVPKKAEWQDFLDKYTTIRAYAFVCEKCGTEAFAKWYMAISLKQGGMGSRIYQKYFHGNIYDYNNWFDQECSSYLEEYEEFKSNLQYSINGYKGFGNPKHLECPICGTKYKIFKNIGFYYEAAEYGPNDENRKSWEETLSKHDCIEALSDYYDMDSIFNIMRFVRYDQERESISNYKDYINIEEDSSIQSFSPDAVQKIKNNKDELKQFIKKLIDLEMDIYTMSERLKSLLALCPENDRRVYCQKILEKQEKEDVIISAKNKVKDCKTKLEDVDHLTFYSLSIILPSKPIKPVEPRFAKAGLFNKKRTAAENEQLQKEYDKRVEAYQKEIEEYEAICVQKNMELEKRKNELKEEYTAELEDAKKVLEQLENEHQESAEHGESSKAVSFRDSVLTEIETVKSILAKMYLTREAYYDTEVVFVKYRNVVALSTFYEYLISGRCEFLEGTDGAYNLYESEIRANLIISKLTTIIDSLDSIKENQYLIYSELKKANSSLKKLDNKMDNAIRELDDINENTESIKYNTEAAAFYAKKNAELTDALGYMVALK